MFLGGKYFTVFFSFFSTSQEIGRQFISKMTYLESS